MEALFTRCCGIDVHKRVLVVCVRLLTGTTVEQHTRQFGTTARELAALVDWICVHGCTHVAMESTGVFWRPIYQALADRGVERWVVNAQHLKRVPGRKTDRLDAEWLAQLLQYGLVRPSFVPPPAQQALRDLTRMRTRRIQERVRVINRLHKVLELAGVKLTAVLSDVVGKTGRAILDALGRGVRDVAVLAALAQGRARAKRAALAEALTAELTATQQLLVKELLTQLDETDAAIARLSTAVTDRTAAETAALQRLQTIPGVGLRTAEVILAEVGAPATLEARFLTAAQLCSWAGLCPGNNESAGQRGSGRCRPGNPWLKRALVEAANSAARTNTYLGAQYRRIASRRGRKKAIVALAHSILVIVYYLLTREEDYQDLGATYFDDRARTQVSRRMVARLERMGFEVTLAEREAA